MIKKCGVDLIIFAAASLGYLYFYCVNPGSLFYWVSCFFVGFSGSSITRKGLNLGFVNGLLVLIAYTLLLVLTASFLRHILF